MTVILGLDPGTTKAAPTGWALVDTSADRVLRYGLLKPNGGEHLAELACQFQHLIRNPTGDPFAWRFDYIAIESPFVGCNAKTGLVLARLVGAYEAVAAIHGIAVKEVTPSAAKSALTGNGKATKVEVQRAVQLRYDIVVPSHCADAIAVALASVEYA